MAINGRYVTQRNKRNHRNPKWKPKGEYVVWVEKEEKGATVYSTNSVFWRLIFDC